MLKSSDPKVKQLSKLVYGCISLSKEAHFNNPSLVSIALQQAYG